MFAIGSRGVAGPACSHWDQGPGCSSYQCWHRPENKHMPTQSSSVTPQVSSGLPGAAAAKPSGGKRPAHTQRELPASMRRVKATTRAAAAPMAESKAIQADAEPYAEDANVSQKTVRYLLRILLHGKAQDQVLQLCVCRHCQFWSACQSSHLRMLWFGLCRRSSQQRRTACWRCSAASLQQKLRVKATAKASGAQPLGASVRRPQSLRRTRRATWSGSCASRWSATVRCMQRGSGAPCSERSEAGTPHAASNRTLFTGRRSRQQTGLEGTMCMA